MLVGATGTGKSTLVDGIVNYALGVQWDDPYRFTVKDVEQKVTHTIKKYQVSDYNL
jgi:polynucleotide 5'-kinase involved in rRNA processing